LGAEVRRTPTIKDVAQLAAVSPATVSLVLNEVADTRISERTARRVRAAAAELCYAPNSLARGLRRRRSDTIVLIGDTITTTPYAVHMIEAVQHVAGRSGLLLFLFNTGGDAAVERAGMTLLARQQVDGLIYARMYHQVVDLPDGLRGNTVLLNARTRRAGPPAVVPDDRGGAYAAVTELLAHGHRRIGFLNDARTPPAAALRLEGYRDALRAYGIRLDRRLVLDAQPTLEAGTAAALELYDRSAFTGLFCFNDRMAIGACRALRGRGLVVPQHVSVVGFDDQEFVAEYAEPPLTTVALPHYAMGERAATALVDLVNGRAVERGTRLVPCQLVRRASVGPAPRSARTAACEDRSRKPATPPPAG
jgi:LacI family transcriptional regulator